MKVKPRPAKSEPTAPRIFDSGLAVWAFAVIVAVFSACGGAAPAPVAPVAKAATPPAAVVDPLTGALEQYRQAFEVRSLEALDSLYLPGLDVVVVYQGGDHRGATAVKAYHEKLLGQAKDVHLRFEDVAILATGPTSAVVTARVEREISDGVATVGERGVITLVFHKVDGKWLIVNEHLSYPPAAP